MKYLIMANSFDNAAEKAAQMDLSLRDWSWCPAYTLTPRIDVYVLDEEL